MVEEAKEKEENGRGYREERERFIVFLDSRLVASCGGADGGKTSDESGGGRRPRRREKEENGPAAGKAGFSRCLDPIFSSLKSSTKPLL